MNSRRGRSYRQAARTAVRRALREDLAGYGDLTGSVFTGDGVARVTAREAGVLSGVAALEETARQVDRALAVEVFIHDGERFADGDVIAELRGPLAAILAAERTALNFLCRLSGVATLTATYVAETAGTRARIAATRKTTPGLRALEKQAVVHGGGTPHRFGLFDGAMIKDNHVAAAGGVAPAVARVRAGAAHLHALEVEVDTLEQLDEALAAGATIVLLDNMDTDLVREAVARVAGRAVVEVVGRRAARARARARRGRRGRHLRRRAHHARALDRPGPRPGGLTVLLVVDVGNTQTAHRPDGRRRRSRGVAHGHRAAPHQRRDSRDAAGPLLAEAYTCPGDDRRSRCRLGGAAGSRSSGKRCARSISASQAFVVGPGARTGIRIKTRNPAEVGADRIVNAVAAYEMYGGPCIVADYGTATTFDVISAEGDYLGGAIAPGIEVSLEALTTRAAKLIKVELIEPEHAIGKSTTEALQSGAVYGFAGEVEGVVHAIWAELGTECPVIATGGLADMIARHTDVIEKVDPFLTLRGIEMVMRRQQRS